MKRLNVFLTDELHTKLKVICSLGGTDMSEVVRGLIEDFVAKEEKKKEFVFPKPKK